MFAWCKKITSLNLSAFNTGNATTMKGMFDYCTSLTSLDLSSFNTSKVTNMEGMFRLGGLEDAPNFKSLDISIFDTSNVTNMRFMFAYLELEELDLSNFDVSNVQDFSLMFYCGDYNNIYTNGNWNTSAMQKDKEMFRGCDNLSGYTVEKTGSEMAKLQENGRYFTKKAS